MMMCECVCVCVRACPCVCACASVCDTYRHKTNPNRSCYGAALETKTCHRQPAARQATGGGEGEIPSAYLIETEVAHDPVGQDGGARVGQKREHADVGGGSSHRVRQPKGVGVLVGLVLQSKETGEKPTGGIKPWLATIGDV